MPANNNKTSRKLESVRSFIPQGRPAAATLLQPVPKTAQTSNGEMGMSESEMAQAYRQLLAIHQELRETDQSIARLYSHQHLLKDRFNAVLDQDKGGGPVHVEPCGLCGFSNCVCEH